MTVTTPITTVAVKRAKPKFAVTKSFRKTRASSATTVRSATSTRRFLARRMTIAAYARLCRAPAPSGAAAERSASCVTSMRIVRARRKSRVNMTIQTHRATTSVSRHPVAARLPAAAVAQHRVVRLPAAAAAVLRPVAAVRHRPVAAVPHHQGSRRRCVRSISWAIRTLVRSTMIRSPARTACGSARRILVVPRTA